MTTTNTCSCTYKTHECKKCTKKKRPLTLLECKPAQEGADGLVREKDGFAAYLDSNLGILQQAALNTSGVVPYPSTLGPYFIIPGSSYSTTIHTFTAKFKGYYVITTNNEVSLSEEGTVRFSIQRNTVNINGTLADLTFRGRENLRYNHSIVLLLNTNDQIRVVVTAITALRSGVVLLINRCNFSGYLLQKV
ncbi:MAG: hypothetical protein QXV60_03715 [Nitrososphaerota archaeon]